MSPRLVLPLLLAGCAGPSAHLVPANDSPLSITQAEATRAPVASVLASADPLAAPSDDPTCKVPIDPKTAKGCAPVLDAKNPGAK